jgi:hypothetical protein
MIELTVKTLDSQNHAFSVPDDVSSSWFNFAVDVTFYNYSYPVSDSSPCSRMCLKNPQDDGQCPK